TITCQVSPLFAVHCSLLTVKGDKEEDTPYLRTTSSRFSGDRLLSKNLGLKPRPLRLGSGQAFDLAQGKPSTWLTSTSSLRQAHFDKLSASSASSASRASLLGRLLAILFFVLEYSGQSS
ncbi:hypothetical protein, partial [Baaleninema simplex]|uniref:hypothetical protein n=1 Tax=Baaleninema simplex TaxID=2862350 RepID=UPI001C551E89